MHNEQGIKESSKNKESDEIVVKMEERDGERIKIPNLDKFVFMLGKWLKVLIRMMSVVSIINIIVTSMLLKTLL